AILTHGLMGAVIVWLAKIVIDFLFLLQACARLMPSLSQPLKAAAPGFALLFASFLPWFWEWSLGWRAAAVAVWMLVMAAIIWSRLLGVDERALLAGRWEALRRRSG